MTTVGHRELTYQIAVVGGGPAGLSAALAARQQGANVILLEERAQLGGQYFKRLAAEHRLHPSALGAQYRHGTELIDAVRASGVDIVTGATVWGVFGNRVAVESGSGESFVVSAARIVLAPGAYDRPFAFPGWTLPGVITAGGAQSLAKYQRVSPGERVVMAGSGPLPLAFSVQLHQLGVNIIAVVEAAPRPTLSAVWRLGSALRGNVGLLAEGLFCLAYLRRHRIPLIRGHLVDAAEGQEAVEAVTLQPVDRQWVPVAGPTQRIAADTLCIGYGLLPSTELIAQAGCQLQYDADRAAHVPLRDEWMRSSVPHIYCPGDGGGIDGAHAARAAGWLTGLAISADLGLVDPATRDRLSRPARWRLNHSKAFQAAMRRLYPIGKNPICRATPDTVVCRCEEVSLAQLRTAGLGRGAMPHELRTRTRLGMGFCQGRNCASSLAALVAQAEGIAIADLPRFTPRPPVKPVSIGAIARAVPEIAHVDLTH